MIRNLKKHFNEYDNKFKKIANEIMDLELRYKIKHKLLCIMTENELLEYLKELKENGRNYKSINDSGNNRNFSDIYIFNDNNIKRNSENKGKAKHNIKKSGRMYKYSK